MRLRKRRLWRPFLRPAAGRKLPPELRADSVGSLAAALPDGLRDPGFQILLRRIDQSPLLEGNRVRACFRGLETFEAMRAAIDAARAEVLVESYIFKDDATGRSLLETFVRAVDRGVRVCVLERDAFSRRGGPALQPALSSSVDAAVSRSPQDPGRGLRHRLHRGDEHR